MPAYLSAAEAATRLAVSRQTLYAYVSRGLLRAHDGPSARESRYLAEEVERLAHQRANGRRPKEVAQSVLDWGLPVLESAITLIANGKFFYRGQSAIELAQSYTVEQVAGLLWQLPPATAFGASLPTAPSIYPQVREYFAGRRSEESLLSLFTIASEDAPTASWQKLPSRIAEGNGMLVRLMTACLLGTEPTTAPIHQQCATAWGLDDEGADLVRMALVLCADHELNASGFTGRCVASTGASLRAAVIASLAALTGARHGAATARVEALWNEISAGDDFASRVQQRLDRGDYLPGFGHHLYPDGDVRAAALLNRILPQHPEWHRMVGDVVGLAGQPPSVDFALVALRRHLNLPLGAAFGLFALGRTVGWIAHAMEQRQSNQLIRPRAAYVGSMPETE